LDQITSAIFTIIIIFLSGLGWTLSFYFYGVHKKTIPDIVWWIPKFLQMAKCRCGDIVESKYGKILGRSNSFWGIWYYLALIIISAGNYFFFYPPFISILIISILSVLFSIYLMWGLYSLRIICRTCLGVHVINILIMAVAILRAILYSLNVT
jgi:uncharacterized membrane protein